jgi:hypothetical protein
MHRAWMAGRRSESQMAMSSRWVSALGSFGCAETVSENESFDAAIDLVDLSNCAPVLTIAQ